MIIEIIIALVAGIVAGLVTGLMPGIHINLVASFIVVFLISSSNISLPLSIFIMVLSVTHTIIDFIPTTLLGVPGEDNFLSILPSHQLVLQGRAYEAIKYAICGCAVALPVFLILVPAYIFLLPYLFNYIEKIIPYVLVLSSVYLILRGKNPVMSLFLFILSGAIGFYAFNLPVKEPLLPLLTGLFGLSSLLSNLSNSEKEIKQSTNEININKIKLLKPTLIASIVSPIFSFFPAIGAGHISLFSSEVSLLSPRQFIFLNGFCSAITMNLSIVAAYSIGKTRTGTAATINSLLPNFGFIELAVIVLFIIISTFIAYFIAKKLSKKIIWWYCSINYKRIAIFTLVFVLLINLLITNSLGIIILVCGSALGLLCILTNTSRIQLMGSLLLPTILYYFI